MTSSIVPNEGGDGGHLPCTGPTWSLIGQQKFDCMSKFIYAVSIFSNQTGFNFDYWHNY